MADPTVAMSERNSNAVEYERSAVRVREAVA